ncbi:hypothetical protein [Limnohabitans sp. JirII-29]|uniref:hypothetical protein n=1 Tax=Limnohabitans sp. JirII-29 TaxID=1835756 RepID=UPI001304C745|nr:hypothetical protein [Limnohabitans sp. JirII-29]
MALTLEAMRFKIWAGPDKVSGQAATSRKFTWPFDTDGAWGSEAADAALGNIEAIAVAPSMRR